jgi:hypothetical protein
MKLQKMLTVSAFWVLRMMYHHSMHAPILNDPRSLRFFQSDSSHSNREIERAHLTLCLDLQ